ncbi:MAG TPA: hypothetical protein VFA05_11080 [Gaiellaceae bacterium]|nr:hypothetical protein [Gaiellaceae bacterium]
MVRLLLSALAAFVLLLPATALAAGSAGHHYRVGQKCSAKLEKQYKAQHFTCVKGKLRKMK